jgi:hypothetical protein
MPTLTTKEEQITNLWAAFSVAEKQQARRGFEFGKAMYEYRREALLENEKVWGDAKVETFEQFCERLGMKSRTGLQSEATIFAKVGVFLRRYDRLLSVLGTIVLVMTFIVRDVEREKLRDVTERVQQAEEDFNAINYDEAITLRLDAIANTVLESAKISEDTKVESKLLYWIGSSGTRKAALKRLADLAAKLGPPFKSELDSINQMLAVFEQSEQMREKERQMSRSPSEAGKLLDVVVAKGTQSLQEQLLTHADTYKQALEDSYKKWTDRSYALFTFGAFLTIIGKIFKIEGIEGIGG